MISFYMYGIECWKGMRRIPFSEFLEVCPVPVEKYKGGPVLDTVIFVDEKT